MKKDFEFMRIAIEEAKKDPRQMKVGAVVVKDDRIMKNANGEEAKASGTKISSDEHAEYSVLERILNNVDVKGATLYTTLEPCTKTYHNTNPRKTCTKIIQSRGIERVVIGIKDPNPDIYETGIIELREKGINVEVIEECENEGEKFAKEIFGLMPEWVEGQKKRNSIDFLPDSDILIEMQLNRHQIIAYVYNKYALDIDDTIRSQFDHLNSRRRNDNLAEHYPATRYRIIKLPEFIDGNLELHLAPINFAYRALWLDHSVPTSAKMHISIRINEIDKKIEEQLRCYHKHLNGKNIIPLGVEIVLITSDHKTLLRNRGRDVLTGIMEWDTSFSGYCGIDDLINQNCLDIGKTVEHELSREIGTIAIDSRKIVFTGLHRNKSTKVIDILGYLKTEIDSNELIKLLSKNETGITQIFETTKRAPEQFVWNTKNLIVDFSTEGISKILKEKGTSPKNFQTEGLASIVLALKASGMNTKVV